MTHPTTSLPSSDSGTQSTSFTTTTASPPPTTLSMPLSSSQPSTNESSNSFLSSFSKTASTIQSGLASSLPPTVSSASTTDPPREGQNSVVINPLPTPASGQAQSIQLHPTSPYVLTLPSASSSSNFSSFTSDFSTIFTVPDSNSGANSFNQSRSSAFYTYSTIPNSNPRFVTPGESSLSSFSLSHSFSTSFAASDNLNREPLSLNSIKGRMARAGVSAEEDLSEVVCLFDSNLRLIRRVKGAKQTMLCLSHRCLPCGSLFMASQRNYQKGLSSFGVKQRQEIFRLKEMNDEVANPNGVLLRSTNFGSPSDSIQFGIVSAVHIECFLFLCLVKHVVERVVHTQFWAVAENRNAVLVGVESLDDIWRIIGMLSNRKMNGEFIVIEFAAFER
ncbi:hypothetical protein BLNAU_3695 [Blattamonas nauphoetae]|uniref:Uncharacterized protein n=1 Tax=Blattamonas nauphoetae TaxID=2049346 RepID=A0ABQ9YCB5_9EUKA|nr:hypothetical protein BLNAU_3695 [Blattamonas nauphoetae]